MKIRFTSEIIVVYFTLLIALVTFIACGVNKSIIAVNKSFSVDHFCNLLHTDDDLNCLEYTTDSTRVDVVMDEKGVTYSVQIFDTDIQSDMTERDAKLYKESCFEIFFDPDADGLYYYEIEVNAKGAIFDYILKDAVGPLNTEENMISWHIPQSNLKVHINGTLNDSSDTDRFWSFDLRIPWSLIKEGRPAKGSHWAFNFMRVDRDQIDEPTYWVWKPTGTTLIHKPDAWPQVEF